MRLQALMLVLIILNLLQKDEFGPLLSTYAVEWEKKSTNAVSNLWTQEMCEQQTLNLYFCHPRWKEFWILLIMNPMEGK